MGDGIEGEGIAPGFVVYKLGGKKALWFQTGQEVRRY